MVVNANADGCEWLTNKTVTSVAVNKDYYNSAVCTFELYGYYTTLAFPVNSVGDAEMVQLLKEALRSGNPVRIYRSVGFGWYNRTGVASKSHVSVPQAFIVVLDD